MSRIKHFKLVPALVCAWFLLAVTSHSQVVSRLSTRFLARGEQALLEVSVSGLQPAAFPEFPEIADVEIRPNGRGAQTRLMPGRRLEYVFEYIVSSYAEGKHTIPAVEVLTSGDSFNTQPLDFTVFNPDELQWSEAVAGGTRFRYASAFRVLNDKPYNGETTPVEIKLFVPRDLFVEDWGIPDLERDGLTAWRFQPSGMRGQVNLLGMPYISVAYPSTLAPTRTGPISIGPANLRLITTQVIMEGTLRRVAQEVNLQIAKLDLESLPLPAGAPEGFENAVGTFSLKVTSELTEAQEGDPIPVEIVVSGTGNLDALRPPAPVDGGGWKLYDPTAEQRGDERRELSGTTVFNQFMRPLELKSAIPPFRLVYFDPKKKSYETLLSEPIPLRMIPASAANTASVGPPQAKGVPVERMTDILGIVRGAGLTLPAPPAIPRWLPHLLAGVLALGLIGKALWMRHGHRFRKDPVREARLAALRKVETMKGKDDAGFLTTAGNYIESWLGDNPPQELRAVLAERDAVCFRQEKPDGPLLDSKRRRTILKALRKASLLVSTVILLALGTGSARADDPGDSAQEAYDSARYDEAIGLWLEAGPYENLSATTLFNIGNACYRAGTPGHAALYYRRALARDPGHEESRQNLRFIERKHGSITIHRPEFQDALTRLPLSAWKGILWAGAWLCLLGALVFPATRPGARLRVPAIAALIIAPLLAACGALGWHYFPNDAEFAPLDRQAVVVGQDAVLHADASRTSPEVIDAPPGSLCEVIRESGRWAYVAFATKTRGWVPIEDLEKILPASPPAPPKIRKPKVDGKSA